IKAALICLHGDGSTYDKNFIDAFKTACANKGLTDNDYAIKVNIEEGQACYDEAAAFADDGYDIVFADSFGHEPYMLQAAREFPDVEFCHATGTQAHTAKLANFHDAFASIYEARYMAGVAAGLKLVELYGNDQGVVSDSDAKIGYVGAFPYAEVISGFTSFFLGVKSIVPNVTMEVRYTNSWFDITAENTTATALIESGCKLISQHADSMGAPNACETADVPNVAYNIATGTDTFVIASRINWVPYFEYCLDCVMNNKAIDTDWVGTLANGAVQVTALGANAAEGTQAKLDEVRQALLNGEIKVFNVANFTIGGVTPTSMMADVDDDGTYSHETEALVTEGGVTYFAESTKRSAPYFDFIIDGITSVVEN
ncbi:MAG: BMP family ABC transporter substrate-binding protein, partial [Clostridia bacterium]|nr:BMP family ABC transporter substrate-binding protein [Clostridia bacterium]